MQILIIKYGEIALKGKNRYVFENILIDQIKRVLSDYEEIRIEKSYGRIFLYFKDYDMEAIINKVKNVFGIVSLSPGVMVDNSIDEMNKLGEQLVRDVLDNEEVKTFKVETSRPNKNFELISPEVSRRVGGYIFHTFDDLAVDVHNPDFVLNIEIRDKTYLYTREIKGYGGMPYGSSSKGMLLLSGGIDSPVAGFQMARRGVALEAVHFHVYPFTSERSTAKVLELARKLTKYTGEIKVHTVNILEIYKAIQATCPDDQFTIHARRFMTLIAERLAEMNGCKALITGENIAQVASQTMESINTTNAVVQLPIFRPLIAYDKQDIIDIAKDIDTYETSILPYEDCCTVFLPDSVVTRPKLDRIESSEENLETEALVQKALETLDTVVVKHTDQFNFK